MWRRETSNLRSPISHLEIQRAGNGTRTRDPNLGKVVLYQLSYSRLSQQPTLAISNQRKHPATITSPQHQHQPKQQATNPIFNGDYTGDVPDGGEGNRTPDLLNAIQALSQLSYAPGPPKRPSFRNRKAYAGVGGKSSKSLWRNTLRTVSSTRRWPGFACRPSSGFQRFLHLTTGPSALHRINRLLRSLRTSRHA